MPTFCRNDTHVKTVTMTLVLFQGQQPTSLLVYDSGLEEKNPLSGFGDKKCWLNVMGCLPWCIVFSRVGLFLCWRRFLASWCNQLCHRQDWGFSGHNGMYHLCWMKRWGCHDTRWSCDSHVTVLPCQKSLIVPGSCFRTSGGQYRYIL